MAECSLVRQYFYHAASEPEIWREMAIRKYGERVAEATIPLYQGNWKDMVADHNMRGAFPTIILDKPLFGFYKLNNTRRFYCCMVKGLQWNRCDKILRLHLDARGETDLRHPRDSFIRERDLIIRPTEWIEQVGTSFHYKGYLAFHLGLQLSHHHRTFLNYMFFYAVYQGAAALHAIEIFQGNLNTFDCDHYMLDESLFVNDTPDVERARWEAVVPTETLERPEWWV